MKNQESHISSVIVHIEPNCINEFIESLITIPALEIMSPERKQGKIIVVIEAPSEKSTGDHIEMMKSIKGVLSVTMVYHQTEATDSLDEEVITISDNT